MTKKRDIKGLIEIDKMPHQIAVIKQYLDGSWEDGSEAYGLNFPWKNLRGKRKPSGVGKVFQVLFYFQFWNITLCQLKKPTGVDSSSGSRLDFDFQQVQKNKLGKPKVY